MKYKEQKAHPAQLKGLDALSPLLIVGKPFFQRLIIWLSLDPCTNIMGFWAISQWFKAEWCQVLTGCFQEFSTCRMVHLPLFYP